MAEAVSAAAEVIMAEAPEHFCKVQERNVTILNESVHHFLKFVSYNRHQSGKKHQSGVFPG